MATKQSTKVALAGSQPRGLKVGLCSDYGVYSLGAGLSLSAGDVIQMVKVPKGASLVYFQLTGGSGDALISLGDGVDADRYLTSVTMGSNSALVRVLNNSVGNVPYVYSVDDTIDITVGTVSVGTITGGFQIQCIFSMDPQ
jgi:hypothetical protein